MRRGQRLLAQPLRALALERVDRTGELEVLLEEPHAEDDALLALREDDMHDFRGRREARERRWAVGVEHQFLPGRDRLEKPDADPGSGLGDVEDLAATERTTRLVVLERHARRQIECDRNPVMLAALHMLEHARQRDAHATSLP